MLLTAIHLRQLRQLFVYRSQVGIVPDLLLFLLSVVVAGPRGVLPLAEQIGLLRHRPRQPPLNITQGAFDEPALFFLASLDLLLDSLVPLSLYGLLLLDSQSPLLHSVL